MAITNIYSQEYLIFHDQGSLIIAYQAYGKKHLHYVVLGCKRPYRYTR